MSNFKDKIALYQAAIDKLDGPQRQLLAELIQQEPAGNAPLPDPHLVPQREQLIACLVAKSPAGGDNAIELQKQLSDRLPQDKRPDQWLWMEQLPRTEAGTLDRQALTARAEQRLRPAPPPQPGRPATTGHDNCPVSGPLPLLPIQHDFLNRNSGHPNHCNHSLLFSLSRPLEMASLERAVQILLLHHDALRTAFHADPEGWRQSIGTLSAALPVRQIAVPTQDPRQLQADIRRVADRLNGELDLTSGLPLRFVLLRTAPGMADRLLVIAHQLVMDARSWQILVEDFERVYQQLEQGLPANLPDKTCSIKAWANRLHQHASCDAILAQTDFWRQLVGNRDHQLPLDGNEPVSGTTPTNDTTGCVSRRLDSVDTQVLQFEVTKAFQAELEAILLSALSRTLCRWLQQPTLTIDVEDHSRKAVFKELDLSRTIGALTLVYPLVLAPGNDIDNHSDPLTALANTKAMLQQLPDKGLGYGLLRERTDIPSANELRQAPDAQFCFSYCAPAEQLTNNGALLHIENAQCGVTRHPAGRRRYLLELKVDLRNGRLQTDWHYSPCSHQQATIACLADHFITALQALIAAGSDQAQAQRSDADSPQLAKEELDRLADLLEQIDDEYDD